MRFGTIRRAAIAVLLLSVAGCKGDPSTPEYWDKSLKGAKKTKDRERVLQSLRESGKLSPAFLKMLHENLTSEKRPEVKKEIARLLGELKDPSSVDPLTNSLELGNTEGDTNAMNKEIVSALARIGDAKATPVLLKLLKSRDHYTRIEAINALGALKAKEAVPQLMEIATDDSIEPFICKKAVQALGEIGDPKATDALVRMMFKERRGVSFYVESSFALYQIGKPAADALLPVLSGEDKKTLAWAEENRIIVPAVYAKSAQVLGDLLEARAEKPLLNKLNFQSDFLDVKLFVRMRAADALGRLRSKEAIKPLTAMLNEEEATARAEYIRALVRIGSRDALPALIQAAGKGSWDAREGAMAGVAMLGDEREQASFDKWIKDEPVATSNECKEDEDYAGCKEPAKLGQSHVATIEKYAKRLAAAKECKSDASCWAKKLNDADGGVVARAAYEVGRSKNAELTDALVARLGMEDLEARLAVIQGLDWLTRDSEAALKKAQGALEKIDKQLEAERSKTQFVKVNEDLRRLAVKLHRGTA